MSGCEDAAVVLTVPLKTGGGERVVAATADGKFHLIKVIDTSSDGAPEQSFTATGARQLAEKVLAGDELAMTGRGTLRILAAALLIDRTQPDTSEARALAGQCRLQARDALDPGYEVFMARLSDFLEGIASS